MNVYEHSDLGLNFICRTCYFPIPWEISPSCVNKGYCLQCSTSPGKASIFLQKQCRKESFLQLHGEAYANDLSTAFTSQVETISKKFMDSKSMLSFYSRKLKEESEQITEDRRKKLGEYEEQVMTDLSNLRRELETLIYAKEFDATTRSGRVAKTLLANKSIGTSQMISVSVVPDADIEKVFKSAVVQRCLPTYLLQQEPCIFLFAPGETVLTRIHIYSHIKTPVRINAKKEWIKGANWVHMNDETIFYCGGETRFLGISSSVADCWIASISHEENAYIVDTTPLAKRRYHALQVIMNKVYVFGGCTDVCQCFDPDRCDWINLAKLPCDLERVSSIKHDNSVYLCGSASSALFKYQLDNNTYMQIVTPFIRNSSKAIFDCKDFCVLFCGNIIFAARIGTFLWSEVGHHSMDKDYWSPGEGKVVEGFLYFLTEGNVLQRMNLSTFELKSFPLSDIPKGNY